MNVVVSVAPPRFVRQLFLFLGALVFLGGTVRADGGRPFFFIQLSDPQFGMNAQNSDLTPAKKAAQSAFKWASLKRFHRRLPPTRPPAVARFAPRKVYCYATMRGYRPDCTTPS